MICDECKKNQASYHSIKKYNGISTEKHLCNECYVKQGVKFNDVNNLFAGFTGLFEAPRRAQAICKKCGTSSVEFLESGFVGCAECYNELESAILPVIKRVQSGTQHIGKLPNSSAEQTHAAREYERLQQELSCAIEIEDFEQAMVLRDKIRALKEAASI